MRPRLLTPAVGWCSARLRHDQPVQSLQCQSVLNAQCPHLGVELPAHKSGEAICMEARAWTRSRVHVRTGAHTARVAQLLNECVPVTQLTQYDGNTMPMLAGVSNTYLGVTSCQPLCGGQHAPHTMTSSTCFQCSARRSYMPPASMTWRKSSSAGAAPHASRWGMLRSSTKSASLRPGGAPYLYMWWCGQVACISAKYVSM